MTMMVSAAAKSPPVNAKATTQVLLRPAILQHQYKGTLHYNFSCALSGHVYKSKDSYKAYSHMRSIEG